MTFSWRCRTTSTHRWRAARLASSALPWSHDLIRIGLPTPSGLCQAPCAACPLAEVCVESSIFRQLHPARIGYGSCWLYPLPKTCPQTTLPRKYMRGPAVKVGRPFLLLPYTLPLAGVGSGAPLYRVARSVYFVQRSENSAKVVS